MTSKKSRPSNFVHGLKNGYRSGLEKATGLDLRLRSVDFLYEKLKISYLQPAVFRSYTPDFFLLSNGIIIETKGRFMLEDRKKHVLIREQYPWLDIRLVFQNPYNKLTKGSKTTYAAWCDKTGLKWAWKTVPQAWLEEEPKPYLPMLLKLIEEGESLDNKKAANPGPSFNW